MTSTNGAGLPPTGLKILELICQQKPRPRIDLLAGALGWSAWKLSRVLHGSDKGHMPPEVFLQALSKLGIKDEDKLTGTMEYEVFKGLKFEDTKVLLRAIAKRNDTFHLNRREWIKLLQEKVDDRRRGKWEAILNGAERVPYHPEFRRKLAALLDVQEQELFPDLSVNGLAFGSAEADLAMVDRLVLAQARLMHDDGVTATEASDWAIGYVRDSFDASILPNLPIETRDAVVEAVTQAMTAAIQPIGQWALRYAELRKLVAERIQRGLVAKDIIDVQIGLLPPADFHLGPILRHIRDSGREPNGQLVEHYAVRCGLQRELLAVMLLGLAEGKQYKKAIGQVLKHFPTTEKQPHRA